jgi:hypothetical protein
LKGGRKNRDKKIKFIFKKIMSEKEKNKNPYSKYLQLTSIAFQMMAIMFIFIWLGKKADDKWGNPGTNYFTLIGTLAGLGVSLYIILKQLKKLNE